MTILRFFSTTNVSLIATKMMVMEYELQKLFIITILLSIITATASMSSQPLEIVDTADQQQQQTNVLTFPLLPHHVAERRRRNLLSNQQQKEEYQNNHIYNRKTYQQKEEQSMEEYHSTRSRSLRRTDSNNVSLQTSATIYQGWGTHYVDIWVGVPVPQRQTLIIDTGSSLTAFPCSTCPKNDCGIEPQYHIDTLYNELNSTTFTKLHCNECFTNNYQCVHNACIINQKYQEGSSWIAYEATDTCYIGGSHTIPQILQQTTDTNIVTEQQQKRGHSLIKSGTTHDTSNNNEQLLSFGLKFGCQTQLTGLFKEQLADGIMGMDYSPSSFWWQLYESKQISSRSFSLCYSRHTTTDNTYTDEESYMNDLYNGLSAGSMSIGGISKSNFHTTVMTYTDLPKPPSNKKHNSNPDSMYYHVSIRKMYLRQPLNDNNNDDNNDTDDEHIYQHRQQPQQFLYVPIDISQTDIGQGTARVIVDSGTTDTYFPNTILQQFTTAWKTLMNNDEQYNANQPYKTTISSSSELDTILPTIVLQLRGSIDINQKLLQYYFGMSCNHVSPNLVGMIDPSMDPDNPYDVLVYILPSHYYEYTGTITDDNDGTIYYLYESRFFMNRPKNSGVVLGANTMMGHEVYFDLDNYRIGWAESVCSHVKNTNTNTNTNTTKTVLPINNVVVPTNTNNSKSKGKAKNKKVPTVAISPTTSPTTIPIQKVDTITNGFCTSVQCYSLVLLGIVSMIVIALFVRLLHSGQQQKQSKHCPLDQNENQDDENDNDVVDSFTYDDDIDDADDFVNGQQHHFKDRRFRQHHTYDKVILPPVD